jgi:hypothetical protein
MVWGLAACWPQVHTAVRNPCLELMHITMMMSIIFSEPASTRAYCARVQVAQGGRISAVSTSSKWTFSSGRKPLTIAPLVMCPFNLQKWSRCTEAIGCFLATQVAEIHGKPTISQINWNFQGRYVSRTKEQAGHHQPGVPGESVSLIQRTSNRSANPNPCRHRTADATGRSILSNLRKTQWGHTEVRRRVACLSTGPVTALADDCWGWPRPALFSSVSPLDTLGNAGQ